MKAAVQRWWSNRKELQAFDALGSEGRAALARDCGLAEDTLARIVLRGAHAGEELARVLPAAGLDSANIRRTRPDVMRDMEVTCSACAAAKKCQTDLKRGVAWARRREYCPNAHTIASLVEPTRPRGPAGAF